VAIDSLVGILKLYSLAIDMKIKQISPTKLICEDDKFWTSFTQFFAIGIIGAACFIYGSYTANSSFKIGLYGLLVGLFVCVLGSQITTTFDSIEKTVQFKRYWFLVRGYHYKEYPISSIKKIEVYRIRINYYHPAIRLKNGKLLRMTDNPHNEQTVNQDVSIIKGFLKL
jgi:hypothetical protein